MLLTIVKYVFVEPSIRSEIKLYFFFFVKGGEKMNTIQCQNDFLLKRKYDEVENCVEYCCDTTNIALKIDCLNILTKNICDMDKKAIKVLQPHCRDCDQKSYQSCTCDK